MEERFFNKLSLFIIFIMIIMITPNVFATEFNMNNYTSATLGGTKNRYRGTEIYNTGTSHVYTFNTRYQGQLSDIETYFDYPFEANTTYRFTYNMSTNDFNNNFSSSYWWDCDHTMTSNNATVFIPTYISYKKVQFSITPSDNTTCIRVWIRGRNLSSDNITQITNWNLSSITIYDPDFQSGSGSGQGTSPAPTPDPSQSIINNQNENTQDIISSIQETTENVSNTITDTFSNKCKNMLDLNDYLATERVDVNVVDGSLELHTEDVWANIKYKIAVERNTTYYFKGNFVSLYPNRTFLSLSFDGNNIVYGRFWNYEPYQESSGIQNGQWSTSFNSGEHDFVYLGIWVSKDVANNTSTYLNMMFDDTNLSYCVYGSVVSNKIDELANKLDTLNRTIEDDNLQNGLGSNFFNDFTTTDNGGISSLVTTPLRLVNALLSNNSSCANLQLPTVFGLDNVTLPSGCILWNRATTPVITIWNILIAGPLAYLILKDLFYLVEDIKDPEDDRVDTLDL